MGALGATSPPGGGMPLEPSAGRWLGLAALALCALCALCAWPVRVGLHYGHGGAAGRVVVSVRLWPLTLRYSLSITTLLSSIASRGQGHPAHSAGRVAGAIRRALLQATRRVERFEWKTRITLSDAASRCLGAGALWALKGTLIGLLARGLTFLNPPVIEVDPQDGPPGLGVELSCIFRSNVGEIIVALLSGVLHSKKG